jgi:acyl-CoA synthetase (AMP-forming)/AMP-acid ligase II
MFLDAAPTAPDDVRALVEYLALERGGSPYVLAVRDDRRVSFAELAERAALWPGVLAAWGVAPGDRVGLVIADPLEFTLCFVASLAAGMWVAPLDPTVHFANAEQLEHRVANLDLDAIVSDRAAPFASRLAWHDLASAGAGGDVGVAAPGGGVILASSGTTGAPKVVALPIAQLLTVARLVAAHNRLGPGERGLNPLPLWHINAEVVGLLATLVSGASLALDERFHRTGFWSVVDRLEVTWINAVPAIISRLSTLQPGEEVPSRVRFVRSASAPLPPALLEQFEAATGIFVLESYGMTEAASQICVNPLDGPRKVGSVGRPVGVELRVVPLEDDALEVTVAANDVGHVEIKGPSVIRRYEAAGYDDRFDAEGWLRTGDLGYLDDDGYVFLVGRSDDVINRGGEKIFPREIEEVAVAVHGVIGVAVIGAPDEVFGQVPVLFVELDSVSESTPSDELAAAAARIRDALVASFARSRRPVTINIVEKLPAHATGKIQKKALATEPVTVLHQHHLS